MKRMITWLLALILMASALSSCASQAPEKTEATYPKTEETLPLTAPSEASLDFEWEEAEGGIKLVKYRGDAKEVTVPDTWENQKVVKITSATFFNTNAEKVTFNQKLLGREDSLATVDYSLQTITYADGSVYTGKVSFLCPDGKGKIVYASGDVYEGEFSLGVKEGNGTYLWADGSRYTGRFREDLFEGKGSYYKYDKYQSGEHYVGYWEKGQRSGYGMCTWDSGDVYTGYWKDGKMHGEGTYTAHNGLQTKYGKGYGSYIGSWENGLPQGKGTAIIYNAARTGVWDKGLLNGEGIEYNLLTRKVIYKGEFLNTKYHGQGSYYSSEYDYVGEFAYGSPYGTGKVTYPDGTVVEGEFWENGLQIRK